MISPAKGPEWVLAKNEKLGPYTDLPSFSLLPKLLSGSVLTQCLGHEQT